MMGETVARALTAAELDEQSRLTRDRLLDHLEQHLHDVHAFVRSRCLQIWLQLANTKVCRDVPHTVPLYIYSIKRTTYSMYTCTVRILSLFIQGCDSISILCCLWLIIDVVCVCVSRPFHFLVSSPFSHWLLAGLRTRAVMSGNVQFNC